MPARHPRRFLGLIWCLAVASPFAAPLAHTANAAPVGLTSCSAAGCTNPYWGSGQIAAGFGDGPFRPGQTFAPKFSGVLNTVRLGLETVTGNPVSAVAEIRTVTNGLPTTTILAEATVLGAPYTGGVFYAADFTAQNLVLFGGTRYAITLRGSGHHYVLAAFPACPTSTGAIDYVHSYDAGQTWATLQTRDRSIIFEVCMDAATPTQGTTWGRVKAIYR